MKKILIFVLILSAGVLQAQQLSTLKGKTKDGKTLTVQYYQGTVEAYIESVKYQLIDELQANVKNLQSNVNDLQYRLDVANKQIKQLNKDLENCGSKDDCSALRNELAEKTEEAKMLSDRIVSLNVELKEAQDQRNRLQAQLDSIVASNLTKEEKPSHDMPEKAPVIGLAGDLGLVLLGNSITDSWGQDITWAKQAALYFGTARLAESFPISIEAGVGFRKFALSAHTIGLLTNEYAMQDIVFDNYIGHFYYTRLNECLDLTYLDIPIRICIGQPAKDRVTAYFKLGITPSINISEKFVGEGTYTLTGYYPQWDVTLENIEELGFASDLDCYHHEDFAGNKVDNVSTAIKKFNLWGNVALGACVPFKVVPIVLTAGVKVELPILPIGTLSVTDDELSLRLPNKHTGLLQGNGRVVIPSFELGLVYTLK